MDPQSPTQTYVFVPYFYLVASASMAGGGSNIQPLTLDQDADFELHEMTAYTNATADSTDITPNRFSVQITDKNNSHIWSNARIDQAAFRPRYRMLRPVLLAKRSNLNFDFLNTTAGTTLIATVVLHGFKVYPQ